MVLFHPGLNSLIAHIRVGTMQVALEAKTTVLPAVGMFFPSQNPDFIILYIDYTDNPVAKMS